MNYTYLFKYIMIGNSGVGKSSLLYKFINNKITNETEPTIGVEYYSKIINIKNLVNIKLNIFDTAGQECFQSITKSYYRNTIGVLIVYDITNRKSFENVKYWLNECKTFCWDNINIILIGNKNDIDIYREVSYDEGKKLADDNKILFTEISRKQNISEIFCEFSEYIYMKIKNNEYDLNNLDNIGIKLGTDHFLNIKYDIDNIKGSCCFK